jgi:hypothetical protein
LIRSGKAPLRKIKAAPGGAIIWRRLVANHAWQALSQSCEQFLWTNVLARTRARLQALDSAHLFTADENCGTIFCLPNCRVFPGSSQILWTKLCASGLGTVHLIDFPQKNTPAFFLSKPGTRRSLLSRQHSSHFLWTKL